MYSKNLNSYTYFVDDMNLLKTGYLLKLFMEKNVVFHC